MKKKERAYLRRQLEQETVVRAKLFEQAHAEATLSKEALGEVIHQELSAGYYDRLLQAMQKFIPKCEQAGKYHGSSPNVPAYESQLVTVQQKIDELKRWIDQEELPRAKKAKTSSTFVQE
jgi:hypothetical protein